MTPDAEARTTPSDELIRRFEADMEAIHAGAKAIGYNATSFIAMVGEHGGLETAHRLLAGTAINDGFTELWRRGRLDLTVEAHGIKPEYRELFSDDELRIARSRLGG